MISDDVEVVNDNDEKSKETKYHYCWIKNLNKLLYDQKQI